MKVKTILLGLVMLTSLSVPYANNNKPAVNKSILKEKFKNTNGDEKESRIAEIKARVNEIKAMDISKLTKDEKKKLKKELKDMRKEARSLDERDVSIGILGTSLFGVIILLAVV